MKLHVQLFSQGLCLLLIFLTQSQPLPIQETIPRISTVPFPGFYLTQSFSPPLNNVPIYKALLSENESEESLFPGFSLSHQPYTHLPEQGLLKTKRGGEEPLLATPFKLPENLLTSAIGGLSFPGFTITQTAEIERVREVKNQPPHLKPDQVQIPSLSNGLIQAPPYLFPYLFPGASFPGFSLSQNNLQSLVQLPITNLPSGLARPILPEELAVVQTGSRFPEKPWDMHMQEDPNLKPIKESLSVSTQNQTFYISSPEAGKVSIVFKNKNVEAVTPQLIAYLEASLGKFKEFAPSKSNGQKESQDALPLLNTTFNSTPIKAKERLPYGIQSGNKEGTVQSPPRPLIAAILNPLGSLPEIKWPSFTKVIHRIIHGPAANKGRLDGDTLLKRSEQGCGSHSEEKGLCMPNMTGCADFCGLNGFIGGVCEQERCLCYFPQKKEIGLLFRKLEGNVSNQGCDDSCRESGAYVGFCGVKGCFCAVPWHDGSVEI